MAPAATPLPRATLAVILCIQIGEALNGCVLFPFIVFMMRDAGISERNLGWWSGLVGASFFLGQVVSSYHWGRLADRYGCKPCIVFSCVAAGLSSVAFGFAKTAPQAVFVRFVCGLLNGTIGIVKSYVTQITDETNRPAAFALMPLGFGLGLVAASELGGSLSRPADTWPGVFGAKFWRLFPYALPLLVCGAYQLLTALASHLFLAAVDARSGYAAVDKEVDGEDDKLAPEPAPVVPVWRRRGPVLSCMAYATMAGAQILYDELFPLYGAPASISRGAARPRPRRGSSVELEAGRYARGCLGWRSPKIGTFLACGGSAVFFGAFVAPRCLRACGGRQRFAFSIANSLNLPLGLALPALASWYSLFFLFFATRIVQTVAFTAVMLMVNSSTPVSEVGAVIGCAVSKPGRGDAAATT